MSTRREPWEVATVSAGVDIVHGERPYCGQTGLPVPMGMMPSAWPVPETALATVRTVPSPPTAITTSAPSSSASSAQTLPSLSSWVS